LKERTGDEAASRIAVVIRGQLRSRGAEGNATGERSEPNGTDFHVETESLHDFGDGGNPCVASRICRGALKVGQRAVKLRQACAKWDCADFAEPERSGGGAKLALAPVGGVGLAA
jgi:hypothetical protein